MRTDVDRSSIPHEHPVRCIISGLSSAMAYLTATEKKPPDASSTHCATDCSTSSRGVNLPKLALPTFCGDPIKWAAFWERFEEAVDSNDELTQANLPQGSSERSEGVSSTSQRDQQPHSQDLVELLTQRYSQRRLILKNHF